MSNFSQQQQNNVQVRIFEDENDSLQKLFKETFDPASRQKQVPFYQRNLPESFFVQPTGIKSGDGFSYQTNEDSGSFHLNNPATSDLIISHSKAHSSPACLDTTYLNVGTNQMQCENHGRQKSLDINRDELYCNSIHQSQSSTQFSNSKFPRQHQSQDKGSNERVSQKTPTPGPRNQQQASFTQHAQLKFQISDLPVCCEMAVNEEGRVYFLDHKTQNTSWFDPRIPQQFQKWGMTLEALEQLHIAYARELIGQNSQEGIPSTENYSRQQSVVQPHARSFSQPTSVTAQQMMCTSPALYSSLSSSSSLPGGPPPPGPPLAQVLEGLHLTGTQQHSHQGSMDSGVGPSVTGQTPERAVQQYESEMGSCDITPEFFESMSYDAQYPNINLLDNFDMNELGNV